MRQTTDLHHFRSSVQDLVADLWSATSSPLTILCGTGYRIARSDLDPLRGPFDVESLHLADELRSDHGSAVERPLISIPDVDRRVLLLADPEVLPDWTTRDGFAK